MHIRLCLQLWVVASNGTKSDRQVIRAQRNPTRATNSPSQRSRRKKRRAVRATALSLKVSPITEGAHAMATFKSASERIGVLESDIARYILDAVSRNDQTAPCLIEP